MSSVWRFGLAACLGLCAVFAHAQANITWVKRYIGAFGNDDVGQDCAVDFQGNVYVTGSTVTGYDSSTDTYRRDCITIKYDPAGNIVWQQTFGAGDTLAQEGVAICLDSDGNCYVGGNQDWDFLTLKYDSSGNLLWSADYAGPGLIDSAVDIAVDPFGFVLITGSSDQGDFIFQNYLTCRYDPTGGLMWAIRYNGPGDGNDFARAVKVDSAGYTYVTGYSEGNGTGFDCATVKYDPFGDTAWTVRYNYAGAGDDGANDIALDSTGNVFLTGSSFSSTHDDLLTIKYNPSGVQSWAKHYVGSSGGNDSGRVVAVSPTSGDVYVAGYSLQTGQDYDFMTLRYSTSGVLAWSKRYDGTAHGLDLADRIALDSSGSCYVAGLSAGTTTLLDYAVVKYDISGNQMWAQRYDGGISQNDDPHGLALDNTGALVTAGCTQQSANGPCDMTTVRLVQDKLVTGAASLQDYVGTVAAKPIFIEIHAVDGSTALESGSALLDATGGFVFPSNRPNGNYDVYVRVPGWLSKKVRNITIGSNGVSGLIFSLRNGDCDADNEVSIGDYSLLSAAYNSFPGDGNWNASADLNGDGGVDIGDYSILSSNYGSFGD